MSPYLRFDKKKTSLSKSTVKGDLSAFEQTQTVDCRNLKENTKRTKNYSLRMPHTRSPDQSHESRKELKSEASLDNLINGYNFKILASNVASRKAANESFMDKLEQPSKSINYRSKFTSDLKKHSIGRQRKSILAKLDLEGDHKMN